MAKLPWYLKSNGCEITNSGIKLNVKPRKIWFYWLLIKKYLKLL
jgi:hypothetical protein